MKKLYMLVLSGMLLGCALFMGGCGNESAPKDLQLSTKGVEDLVDDSLDNYNTYMNYMELPEEWDNYGTGDPSITKYNGIFYLYASTPYMKTGVRCWSSKDLVNWTFEGNITEEEAAFTAYSPKVIYWNGKFYLYTTPDGKGLHILESNSPTGPFLDVTGNIHDCIDACIFIDDDGTWYMTHGHSGTGVEMHKMPSATSVDEYPMVPGAVTVGGLGNLWTETGQIIKRNEKYFITFSGNHVCSAAYRTGWAVSTDVEEMFVLGDMPLVCSTEGVLEGTACGLVFQGPDLLSDYVVYHNLLNPYVGPTRAMNIDLVNYNGDRILAYSATDFAQTAPELPNLTEYFENSESLNSNWNMQGEIAVSNGIASMNAGANLISKSKTNSVFAAEYNLVPASGVKAVFAYVDNNNYSYVDIKTDNQVTLSSVVDGEEKILASGVMQSDYNANSIHTIRVVCDGNSVVVYVDGMKKVSTETKEDFSGNIGYLSPSEGKVGFIAYTNGTAQSQIKEIYKPTTGAIQAVDFISADGSLSDVTVVKGKKGGQAVTFKEGDWHRYKINSPEEGDYTADITYKSNTKVKIAVTDLKGQILGWTVLPATKGKWNTYPMRNVTLKGGAETVAIAVVEGSCELYDFKFSKETEIDEVSIPYALDDVTGWKYYDGQWSSTGSEFSLNCETDFGKIGIGEIGWKDYSVEGTVSIDESSLGSAGFLLRVQNIANGSDYYQQHPQNDQSYYVYVKPSGEIGISKHNFSEDILAYEYFNVKDDSAEYKLKVDVRDNEITVYLDDKKVISYTDTENPYTTGKIGLHGENAIATFYDIKVTPID